MNYSNVKAGLNKLFLAELMTIAAGFSVAFNEEPLQIIGVVLGLLGAAAFIVNLRGLKQCALDDEGYKKAFNLSIAGLVVSLLVTILSVVQEDSVLSKSANEIQAVFNYLVAYMVLKTTAPILRSCEKNAEADYADKVRKLYTVAFVIAEVFSILADAFSDNAMVLVVVLVAIVAVIVLLVAQIRYIIFLRKSANAL